MSGVSMIKGIQYHGKGRVGYSQRLDRDVVDPFKQGHYSEAFANMDAYIDDCLERLLRQVYSSADEQDMISRFHFATGGRGFADACKRILMKDGVIDADIASNIDVFKNFRNIVLHNLAPTNQIFMKKYAKWWEKIQTQEEFDAQTKQILNEGLNYGSRAWLAMIEKSKKLGSTI